MQKESVQQMKDRRKQFVNVQRLKKARALLLLSVSYCIYTERCKGAARSFYVWQWKEEENVMLLSKVPHNDKVYGKMRIINALFALSFLWVDPILSSQVPVPSCSSKWSERSGGYQANKMDVGKYRLGRDSCERGERRWWFHWETTVFLECQCCGRFPFTGR